VGGHFKMSGRRAVVTGEERVEFVGEDSPTARVESPVRDQREKFVSILGVANDFIRIAFAERGSLG
jgi:hypothetical protein